MGARFCQITHYFFVHVSIHTPPWGRDPPNVPVAHLNKFQFTRPRGGAISPISKFPSLHCFNSHAPVGARCAWRWAWHGRQVSIHTPPWGRDLQHLPTASRPQFQFTRPRGGAISGLAKTRPRSGFNSHAPVGARSYGEVGLDGVRVSIHTPPWGRDSFCISNIIKMRVSIHTPPWGRDAGSTTRGS